MQVAAGEVRHPFAHKIASQAGQGPSLTSQGGQAMQQHAALPTCNEAREMGAKAGFQVLHCHSKPVITDGVLQKRGYRGSLIRPLAASSCSLVTCGCNSGKHCQAA